MVRQGETMQATHTVNQILRFGPLYASFMFVFLLQASYN